MEERKPDTGEHTVVLRAYKTVVCVLVVRVHAGLAWRRSY
jgi:hypothetical protein